MTGADYIATVRLSTKDNETLAEVGETCERVPAESLPWLIEQGLVKTRQQIDAEQNAADLAAAKAALAEPDSRTFDDVITELDMPMTDDEE